jgi:hypothetical protein
MKAFLETIRQTRLAAAEAEIKELRRKLAAKGDNDSDESQPNGDEIDKSDTDSPGKPPKSKKAKKASDDVDKEQDEEEQPGEPDQRFPKGPQETPAGALSDYQRQCKALADSIVLAGTRARGLAMAPKKPTALEDAVTALEIKTGYVGTTANLAKQICYADRVRRGEVASATLLPAKGTLARRII